MLITELANKLGITEDKALYIAHSLEDKGMLTEEDGEYHVTILGSALVRVINGSN